MSDDSQKPTITTGNINAGNVNFGEQTFHGEVTISYGQLADAASDPQREELASLLKELEAALKTVPAENAEDVELVQEYANDAVTEVAKDAPSKKRLEITGESLKKAAENLLAVSPIAVKIAHVLMQIPV